MSTDLDHWHIDATVFKDRVEEIHFISDPARNVRRRQHKTIWEVERSLGRGGFGEVRLERNREDSKTRAVKRIAITGMTLSNSDYEKELEALLEFSKPKYFTFFLQTFSIPLVSRSPWGRTSIYLFFLDSLNQTYADHSPFRWNEAAVFVDFFGWFKDGSDIFLAMEYVSLGDLEKNVKARSGKISESEARDIGEQILLGLRIMHAESFAHRDLKPQNVLVVHGAPDWWIKLADFGLSKRLTDGTAFHTKAGTQSYMAPEILNYLNMQEFEEEYTNSVDIWAVGCIIYRLIAGAVPFPPGRSLVKYCEDRSLFPYDALLKSGITTQGSDFLRQLLNSHPGQRPTATQSLKHPWIIAGGATKRTSLALQQEVEPTGTDFSEITFSGDDFNTVTHNGLKSYVQSYTSSFPDSNISDSQSNLSGSSSTLKQKPHITSMSEGTVQSLNNDTAFRTRETGVHRLHKPLPETPKSSIVTRRPVFQTRSESSVPSPSSKDRNPHQDPNFQSDHSTKSDPGREQNSNTSQALIPSGLKENRSKLIDLMHEHLAKVDDFDFYRRLVRTVTDTSLLDNLLSQADSLDNRKLLLGYLNSPGIRRLVLVPDSLRQYIINLRSGPHIDELPLGLVLTFLRTATFPSTAMLDALYPPFEPSAAPATGEFQQFAAQAVRDSDYEDDSGLKFEAGDFLLITERVSKYFWSGRLVDGGESGVILAACVAKVTYVKTKFDYMEPQLGILNFPSDEIIRLIEPADSKEWWKGELYGKVGLFPVSYVEIYYGRYPRPPRPKGQGLFKEFKYWLHYN